MELWNIKSLAPPPRNTYRSQNRFIDLTLLHSTITEGIYFLTKPVVKKEAALLSRCIYRMKTKFRNDKGLKYMEKMNRALLQMLRLRFTDTLTTYLEILPTKYEKDTYFPTLNMLHYILVRLQGLSKLLVRLCEVSRNAAGYMQERIHIAHMWKIAFIMFSIISRVYVLSKDLLIFCCDFYAKLFPYCNKFKNVGVGWLPEGYKLPNNLKLWLDINWLEKSELLEEVAPNLPIFEVDSDSELEFCDKYINKMQADAEVITESEILPISDEDIGEAVQPVKKLPKLSNSKSFKHLVNHLKTLDDLKNLAKDFNKIKSNYPKTFKKIDKLQCNMLHSLIKKIVKKAKKNRTDPTIVNKCILDVVDILKLHLKV